MIVDAGANIGLTSIFYANKYPEARIIALEPEAANFAVLKKNVRPYPNIISIQAALWKENKQLSLVNPDSRDDGFQTWDNVDSMVETCGCVPGITVEKLMQDYDIDRIDLFKLDIEGAEKEVFEDPSAWISKVGIIVIEFHDRLKDGCSNSVQLATKDFDFKWRNGETNFLVRREYAVYEAQRLEKSNNAGRASSVKFKTKHFRILGTV